MAFELPTLPYSTNALAELGMSQETFEYHHGKHHNTYVVALNGLVEKNPALQGKSLEELVKLSHNNAELTPVFNNAGQHWNHILFWQNLSATGGGIPGKLQAKIDSDLGGTEAFKTAFKAAATTQFGSGWAWLVLDKGKLAVTKTANADTPLVHGQIPLFTVDVWEHAYYLDYQNRRPDFVAVVLEKLANWDFVAANLAKAKNH